MNDGNTSREGLDSDAAEYLRSLVAIARSVAGANIIAAYAAGSIGLGHYLPGRSDIDVAFICEKPQFDVR